MEALKYSPLGVSVVAWRGRDGLFVKDKGEPDNHWTTVVAYKEGEYWLVADSYLVFDSPFKRLAWDYDFGSIKRYSLTPKIEVNWVIDLFKRLFS